MEMKILKIYKEFKEQEEFIAEEILTTDGKWVMQNLVHDLEEYTVQELVYCSTKYNFYIIEENDDITHWICRNKKKDTNI